MSEFFDAQRFFRLARAHFAEHRREYFWFAAGAALVDVVIQIIAFSLEMHGGRLFMEFQFSGQSIQFTIGLLVTAMIFSVRYFKDLTQPGPALLVMMRPASSFEKFLLALLVVGFLFPLVFSVVFWALNYPVVELAGSLYTPLKPCPDCETKVFSDFTHYFPFRTVQRDIWGAAAQANQVGTNVYTFVMLWIMQGIAVGSTVFFRRGGILRTAAAGFLLFLVFSSVGIEPHGEVFTHSQFANGAIAYNGFEQIVGYLVWGGVAILAWLAVYFHIKEREVA
jgi:hypothetical protein